MKDISGLNTLNTKREAIASHFSKTDIQKGQEGSRGGNIIGHTKSGKPIYSSKEHHNISLQMPKEASRNSRHTMSQPTAKEHKDFEHFTPSEHREAAKIHEKHNNDSYEEYKKSGKSYGSDEYHKWNKESSFHQTGRDYHKMMASDKKKLLTESSDVKKSEDDNEPDEEVEKSIVNDIFKDEQLSLSKGKPLPIGTEKVYGGVTMVKTAQGWKYKGKGGSKKEESTKDATADLKIERGATVSHNGENKKIVSIHPTTGKVLLDSGESVHRGDLQMQAEKKSSQEQDKKQSSNKSEKTTSKITYIGKSSQNDAHYIKNSDGKIQEVSGAELKEQTGKSLHEHPIFQKHNLKKLDPSKNGGGSYHVYVGQTRDGNHVIKTGSNQSMEYTSGEMKELYGDDWEKKESVSLTDKSGDKDFHEKEWKKHEETAKGLRSSGQRGLAKEHDEAATHHANKYWEHDKKEKESGSDKKEVIPFGHKDYKPISRAQLEQDVKKHYNKQPLHIQRVKLREATMKYYPSRNDMEKAQDDELSIKHITNNSMEPNIEDNDINKALLSDIFKEESAEIIKGKAVPIGTVRTKGNISYVKTAQGWKYKGDGNKSSKGGENPGADKDHPDHNPSSNAKSNEDPKKGSSLKHNSHDGQHTYQGRDKDGLHQIESRGKQTGNVHHLKYGDGLMAQHYDHGVNLETKQKLSEVFGMYNPIDENKALRGFLKTKTHKEKIDALNRMEHSDTQKKDHYTVENTSVQAVDKQLKKEHLLSAKNIPAVFGEKDAQAFLKQHASYDKNHELSKALEELGL